MGKPQNEREALVFDFGESQIKILHASLSPDGPRALDCAALPFSREAARDEKSQVLKRTLAGFDLSSHPRVFITAESASVFRQVTLSNVPESSVRKALFAEMKVNFSFTEEDFFCAYEPLFSGDRGDGVPEKTLGVFIFPKKEGLALISLVEEQGLRVAGLLSSQTALSALVGASFKDDGKDVFLVDIGFRSARIFASRGNKSLFTRNVSLGGEVLTEMMTAPFFDQDKQVRLDRASAERLKITEGAENPQAAHVGVVRPYLERLSAEIKRSSDYYENQKYSRPLAKAAFAGGGSCLKGLRAFMAQFLGMEVHVWQPENFISPKMPADKKELFVKNFESFLPALGTAQANGRSAVNLLPEEHQSAKQKETKNASARILFFAALAVLLFLTAGDVLKIRGLRAQIRSIEGEWKEASRVQTLLIDTKSDREKIKMLTKGELFVPGFLKELSFSTPSSVVLEEVVYERSVETVLIRGTVGPSDKGVVQTLTEFVDALSKSPFLSQAALASTSQDPKTNRSRFEIRCVPGGAR